MFEILFISMENETSSSVEQPVKERFIPWYDPEWYQEWLKRKDSMNVQLPSSQSIE